jgi:pimeloyl-ACP methyl ester carboxylesterase
VSAFVAEPPSEDRRDVLDDVVYDLPFPESVYDVASTDGVIAKAYDFGGRGAPVVFGHATGLHSHTYAPLIERLRDQFHCYAIDVRAQGAATSPSNGNLAWSGIAEDFASGLDVLNLSGRGDVLGIGHSQGGFSVLSAEVSRPGTYAGAFGFEPVIFPLQFDSTSGDNKMAGAARRRREVFESKQAAYDNFRAKPPFSGIDDECLRAYVQFGFEPIETETGESWVRLLCRGAEEATLFENAPSDLINHLHTFAFPVTIGISEFTNEHFRVFTASQVENLRNGTLMEFPGRSHFGLLERVDEMADIIVKIFTS